MLQTIEKQEEAKAITKEEVTALNEMEEAIMKCTDLTYLKHISKSNPKIMTEMMALYLEHTPPLIALMQESYMSKDWDTLHAVVHKMIPSFSIVGIHVDFENMAKNLQQYAMEKEEREDMNSMVSEIVNVCTQACVEIEMEYNWLKNNNNED